MRPDWNQTEVISQSAEWQKSWQKEATELFQGKILVTECTDIQAGSLWDTMTLKAGESLVRDSWERRLFADCGAASGKSQADTNLSQNSELPAPEAFSIDRIRIAFSKTSLPCDVWRFTENLNFRFWLGKKMYIERPLIGMDLQWPLCPNCEHPLFPNPNPDWKTPNSSEIAYTFTMPINPRIVIVNRQSFFVLFEGIVDDLQGDLKLWCFLEGLYARGVS